MLSFDTLHENITLFVYPTSYTAPCKPFSLNPPLILLMSEQHRGLHIEHQMLITLRVESPDVMQVLIGAGLGPGFHEDQGGDGS